MINKFLTHIWPEEGLYCIATPQKKLDGSGFYYKHSVFSTISSAAEFSKSMDLQKKDCYMAIGTLKEEKYWHEKSGKFKVRTHENMHEYKSLILDVDCGDKKPYKTQKQAVQALISFVEETGLPKPTVVSSGYGLHVYFTFSESISTEVWYNFSIRLKKIAGYYKLGIDNSRTSDKSSVLRVAGTHNYKNTGVPVEVLKWGVHTSPLTMKKSFESIIKYIKKEGGKLDLPKSRTGSQVQTKLQALFSGVTSNTEENFNPSDGEVVLKKCNFMAQVKACGGNPSNITEPMWRDALSISRKFATPIPYDLSKGNPNFNESFMLAKLDWFEQNDAGPATCARIKEHTEHDWCTRCPHSVTSPIVLGNKRVISSTTSNTKSKVENDEQPEKEDILTEDLVDSLENDVDSTEVDGSEDRPMMLETSWGKPVKLPDAPFPYIRSEEGVFYKTDGDEDGLGEIELIYRYDIFPWQIIDDKAGIFTVGLKVKLPGEEEEGKPFIIPFHALQDLRLFGKLLADVGIIPIHTTEKLLTYMKAYIDLIQHLIKPVISYTQLGWQEEREKFIFPDKTLVSDGTYQESSISRGATNATGSFRKQGTLEGWKEVIDIYARPGYEPHAFGHCVGYGSILLSFTGYNGGVVNIMGNTGSGKTTIAKTVNSIFGHPEEPMLVHHDKYLAKINRLGVFNSVCVTYDEITNISSDEISDFCYSITQGRGRHRLNQNAEEKQNDTSWKLIMVSTSNESLMGKLSLLKSNSSAESMRIFEYRVDPKNVMTKEEAGRIFDEKLYGNYGHAGELFVEYIMRNKQEVKSLIQSIMLRFDRAADIIIPERYWSAIVSCSLAGGYISNKIGLTNFDMDEVFSWCVNQVKVMRGTVEENNTTPISLLTDFMNSHLDNRLTMSGGTSVEDKMYQDRNVPLPRSNLLIRHEKDVGRAYIDRKAIGEWLKKGGSDFSYVKKTLMDLDILLNVNVSKVLATGSDIPMTGQTKCWLVNLEHPKMLGNIKLPSKDSDVDNVYNIS